MADSIKNLDLRRSYQAQPGGRGRHFRRAGASVQGTLSNWISSIVNSRISEREKSKIANRAWDLYLNDAMGHGIIEGLIAEVVNIGLTPQPDPMMRWLKKDQTWQLDYQRSAYDLFEIWGLDPRNWCDTTRRCNIYMLQALAYFQWKLEGIGVFQVVYQKEKYRPLSLSILPLDPARLVTPTGTKKDIYDGVEIGTNGETEAVWVLKPDKPYYTSSAPESDCMRIDAVNEKTGLPNILLVCDVRNVAEYRQDSIIGSMIKEIKDSNDFVDAALVKSLIANLWTMFVESEQEATRLNRLQGGQTDSGATSQNWSDRVHEIEKGTIIVGTQGEKPTFLDSNAPGDNYEKMNDSIIGRLGMATGRGPENVSRSYKASYSASRASIEDANKFNDSDRMILTNRFCQPVMMLMEYEAALRGILPVTSIDHFLDNLYAYTRTQWLPPPLRPIDHQKEARADTERLNNHSKTYARVFGERSSDWRQELRQSAVERQYIKELENEFGVSMSINGDDAEVVEPEGNQDGQEEN